MASDAIADIKATFFQECEEHLDDLVRFAHAYETSLDHLRAGRISATPAGTKVMLRAADMLADLVRAARDGGAADIARGEAIIEELVALGGDAEDTGVDDGDGMDGLDFMPVQVSFDSDSLSGGGAAPSDPSSPRYVVKFKPKPGLYAKANEAGLLLRELARLGEAKGRCCRISIPKART